MKILRLIHSANPKGGGVIEGVRITTSALVARGCTIDVVSLDAPEVAATFQLSIPVTAVGPGKTNYGYCPALDDWLDANLKRYDCVIVEGMWQYHGFAVWKVCRRLGKKAPPYYVFTHGMLDPWFKRAYPLKHLKKWLYWPWAEYRVLRDARAVLFTAEEECRLARESFWLYRCNEEIVHYGTPLPDETEDQLRAAWAEKSPVPPDRPYLLYLGRLHPKKGADLLLQAYREIKQSTTLPDLILAGPEQDAAFTSKLRALAANDPQIHFAGMVQGAAKWGALLQAEAMILPSHQENFGIVVAEALAMGTPVLISDKINIWREVQSAGAGIVAPDTLPGVNDLLLKIIETTPEARMAMKSAAKLCYTKYFSLDKCVDQLTEIISA